MISLNVNSIVYLICPSKAYTGGPLALHQLGYKLRQVGINAVMYYYPLFDNPVNENFLEFNIPYTDHVIDHEDNIIIVPEIATHYLYNFNSIKKAIWWLSVDNFYWEKRYYKERIKLILGLKKKLKFKNASNYYHFAQSEYAYQYLIKKGICLDRVYKLSDFLLDRFFDESEISEKKDIIVYNPKKGLKITKFLIENSPEFNWVPIQNMSPKEVQSLLRISKLYIDFGEHPGKDRFPREAAICGCCIITGKKGAAAFYQDIPISEKYKFDNPLSQVKDIKLLISKILIDYDDIKKDFHHYIDTIKKQESLFENEIKMIFRNYFKNG